MIIIGLTQQVNTDAELTALTGLLNQDIIWHNGLDCGFMFRNNVASGAFQADDNSGYWICEETLTGLDLDGYKHLRYKEIDLKTEQLIFNGFPYANKVFSMSIYAQMNLEAHNNSRSELTYPFEITTIDDNDNYFVQDATDMHSMYLDYLTTKDSILNSGTLLKNSIRLAIDAVAVSQIPDNR